VAKSTRKSRHKEQCRELLKELRRVRARDSPFLRLRPREDVLTEVRKRYVHGAVADERGWQ
jgi:hypothetical protein